LLTLAPHGIYSTRSRQRSITPMHELAICQSVLEQVLAVASSPNKRQIGRITLRIGPLAGVEPALLRIAFPLVAVGTPCEGAMLEIEETSVRVRCQTCGSTSDVPPNRLLCADCGAWRVTVVSGDEMLLANVTLGEPPAVEKREQIDV
jgi:hydrogenase nickel incorporation protein HypA/HybF